MKRFALVIIILFLASCAGVPVSTYVIPQHIKDRPTLVIYKRAYQCLKVTDGEPHRLKISPEKSPNAWVDKDNVVFLTEGLFKYDDNAITFIITHELSHAKLKHLRNRQTVSLATTGAMMVLGFIVPGAGVLNHLINPAITNNFSKSQEYDADRLASETLVSCFNLSIDKQIHVFESLKKDLAEGGGFWDQHPLWDDRIENIKKPLR
jgi:Zn-dependent protease with chaperone function